MEGVVAVGGPGFHPELHPLVEGLHPLGEEVPWLRLAEQSGES